MAGTTNTPINYLIGGVAFVGALGSLVNFVWQGGRSDISALEGRLDRSVAQLERQIAELKAGDQRLLPKEVHDEFKSQIERQVFRNTQVVDELLVKKEVFDRALADQKTRDDLSHGQHDKDIDMLRSRIGAIRQQLEEINRYLRDRPAK